jgi:phosphatidate phosphatase APP1
LTPPDAASSFAIIMMKLSMLWRVLVILACGCATPFCAEAVSSRPAPVTVVSDIDDTIKDTHLWAFGIRHFLLNANAFFASQPIPGMPETYRRWRGRGCDFIYVSAKSDTPAHRLQTCQFIDRSNLPHGKLFLRPAETIHLFNKLATPTYKCERISPLIAGAPGRRFILVGDSGEYDPESYGMLARKFGDRIAAIYIRQATNEPIGSLRYAKAFQNVPPGRWRLFCHPAELGEVRLADAGAPQTCSAGPR